MPRLRGACWGDHMLLETGHPALLPGALSLTFRHVFGVSGVDRDSQGRPCTMHGAGFDSRLARPEH